MRTVPAPPVPVPAQKPAIPLFPLSFSPTNDNHQQQKQQQRQQSSMATGTLGRPHFATAALAPAPIGVLPFGAAPTGREAPAAPKTLPLVNRQQQHRASSRRSDAKPHAARQALPSPTCAPERPHPVGKPATHILHPPATSRALPQRLAAPAHRARTRTCDTRPHSTAQAQSIPIARTKTLSRYPPSQPASSALSPRHSPPHATAETTCTSPPA